MSEWTQCGGCRLKHAIRPDGKCPRCGLPGAGASPGAGAGWGGAAPVPAPAGAPGWSGVAPTSAGAPPYAAAAPHAFLVGRFLAGSFETWWKSLPVQLALVVLFHGPLACAMYWLYSTMGVGGRPAESRLIAVGLVSVVFVLVLMPIETVAMARVAVRRARGEPAELGDAVAEGLRRFLPALAVMFLVGLAVIATACTLLIVPMMLMVAWAPVVPVLTAERLGPIQALTRSWALTNGLRWQVFAGFLVLWLAAVAVQCVFQGVAVAVVVGVAAGASRGAGGSVAALGGVQAVNMLVSGLVSTLFVTATGVCYHQLRVATEGPESQALAQVFA